MTRSTLALPFLSALLILALLPAGTHPAAAQESAPYSLFMDVVDVRVVNLELVVTDRRGNRVSGLQPEDFRLVVDGEEVPIDYFTEVLEGRAVRSASDDVRGVPALSPGGQVETSYLVFVDEFFSLPQDRDLVVRSLMEELDHLRPGDRMAVVAFDGTRLEMLSTWSSSPQELRRALHQALARPSHGLSRQAELRAMRGTTRGPTPEGAHRAQWDTAEPMDTRGWLDGGGHVPALTDEEAPELTAFERLHVQRLERQIQAITSAATATLRSFANPPGRKVMLVLSGGWPYSPAGFVMERSPAELDEVGSKDVEQLYGPLADTANRLGYTLYTVDVPAASMAFPLVDAATQTDNERAEWDPGQSFLQTNELRYTLRFIADRTGGRALEGGDRQRSMAEVAADVSEYYWLGFTPTWKEDDRSRGVRVEVTRPGLRVRSRESFLDISRQRSVGMVLESGLLFGSPPQPHLLPLKLGEPRRAGRREVRIPVAVAVPVDLVAFLPADRGLVADLELRIALRDEEGRATGEIPPIPFQVRVPDSPTPGTYVRYDTEIQLRNQAHRIALVVYDKVGGAILSGSAEFNP